MDWLYWQKGEWTTQEVPLISLKDNTFWMGNAVFDGARAFDGCVPDLDLHCQRALNSAARMLLKPDIDVKTLIDLCREGVSRFAKGSELYIRPMFFPRGGFFLPDPETTECAIAIHRLALPDGQGFSACLSPFRRPYADMAPTDAKAACLYPNLQRAISYANKRGFDNAVVYKTDGSIAELATANLMIVKAGKIFTASPDGTFLAGITRARVMKLLEAEGNPVSEISLSQEELMNADEVFSTGNYGKVIPVNKIEDKVFGVGPVCQHIRELYWDFARTCPL
jgi:branched-chain amino acid aminotransferase